jgi:hypothetical protein
MSAQTKQYLGKRAVGQRYGGRHPRTVKRWVKVGVLPPPDQLIRSRPYWAVETLDLHDRQRTIQAGHNTPFKHHASAAASKKGADPDTG